MEWETRKIIIRIASQELAIRNGISEEMARSQLEAMEMDARYAFSIKISNFKIELVLASDCSTEKLVCVEIVCAPLPGSCSDCVQEGAWVDVSLMDGSTQQIYFRFFDAGSSHLSRRCHTGVLL